MQHHGYRDLARIYDLVNQDKDYASEVKFLTSLFAKYDVKTVLDVGCGTGTHMRLLEKAGYRCDGMDLNQEMLDVAREKVKGSLVQGNMMDFGLGKRYGAIICMFAGFNHLLEPAYAAKAIGCFKQHMNMGSVMLIDLHNPAGSGEKEDSYGDIKRKMAWNYDSGSRIEKTDVVFNIDGKTIKDSHTMRIYSIDEMLSMVKAAGFSEAAAYEGYGFKAARPESKNLEVFARL